MVLQCYSVETTQRTC